jgi:hypothetical protein
LWPPVADVVVTVSVGQLGYLLEDFDWRNSPPNEPGGAKIKR